jgi:hypothetical protein
MQVVLVVLTFLGGGGVVTLVVTGVNAILEARRERRPRQRVLAIRSAAETLALVEDPGVKDALLGQLRAEGAALAKSHEPRRPREADSSGSLLLSPKLIVLAAVATVALGVGVALDLTSGLLKDGSVVWAASAGGLLAAVVSLVNLWRTQREAAREREQDQEDD